MDGLPTTKFPRIQHNSLYQTQLIDRQQLYGTVRYKPVRSDTTVSFGALSKHFVEANNPQYIGY